MCIFGVCVFAHGRTKRVTNSQNVRSPKLCSPKELSPGIPRRPTAPREPCADVPAAERRTPRSSAELRVTRTRGNTASRTPHQQRDYIQQQDASCPSSANRRHVTVNSEKFARSQLQVNSIADCCDQPVRNLLIRIVLQNFFENSHQIFS